MPTLTYNRANSFIIKDTIILKNASYFLQVLEEHGILQQMKRFAGTSAGAITAALLAVGYNSYDAEKILGVDFDRLVNGKIRF